MGISPLDLQTMYSQVANVAKIAANAEQSVKVAQGVQQAISAQEVVEQSKKVQQMNEQEKLQSTNQNGSNGGAGSGFHGAKKRNPKQEKEIIEVQNTPRIKEEYLGNRVDITG